MQGGSGAFIGVFLVGLREGLEATLIVSIAAAFLKRNGQSTRMMFAGVALAVLICIGVGVGLNLLSTSLPQAQEDMMETVIGVVAVEVGVDQALAEKAANGHLLRQRSLRGTRAEGVAGHLPVAVGPRLKVSKNFGFRANERRQRLLFRRKEQGCQRG